jgi:hypothetical protein
MKEKQGRRTKLADHGRRTGLVGPQPHFVTHTAPFLCRPTRGAMDEVDDEAATIIDSKELVRQLLGSRITCQLTNGHTVKGRLVCLDRLYVAAPCCEIQNCG